MDTNLLHKYIKGHANEDEMAQIVAWLDVDRANMQEYEELRRLYDIANWIDVPESKKEILTPRKGIRTIALRIAQFAAALILILGINYFIFMPESVSTVEYQTVHAPAGQRVELTLSDGSKVWLNAQTTFRFPTTFAKGKREVFLDGEGYFAVASDEKNPFVVQTAHYSVTALGTEFNVHAYARKTDSQTALLTGRVDISMKNSEVIYSLQPNQRLEYNNGQINLRDVHSLNYFGWKNGLISFEKENMEQLLDKLSLYYDITITIENTKILKDKYTGKLRVQEGIEHALKTLQLGSDFTYQKKDNEIIIK